MEKLWVLHRKAMGLHPKSYGFVEALPLHVGALSLRAEVMPLYIIILVWLNLLTVCKTLEELKVYLHYLRIC